MDIRILIVDDHLTVVDSLRFVFAAAGIEQVMESNNCQEAIAALRSHRFDLVLLDVSLGNGSGLDALRQIKAIREPVPVLIHSFRETPRLMARCFHEGAAGYVVKGQDKNALIRAVCQAAAGGRTWTAEQVVQIRHADQDFGTASARTVEDLEGAELPA